MSSNDAPAAARRMVLGQFDTAGKMLAAALRLRELGFVTDTHSPYPVLGSDEALGLGHPRVPRLVLIGGLLGASGAYLMQYWLNARLYPINVGGRPLHGPESNIPITFELMVLTGAFFAFFGLFFLLGLPRYHHPVFEVEAFRTATLDRFWVSVEVPEPPPPPPGPPGGELVEPTERMEETDFSRAVEVLAQSGALSIEHVPFEVKP